LDEVTHTLVTEERVEGYWIKIQYQPVEEKEKRQSERQLPRSSFKVCVGRSKGSENGFQHLGSSIPPRKRLKY
jgi:hypothetical protein